MGFRQEIDEEFERRETEIKQRQTEVDAIRKHGFELTEEQEDKILHPEDYDDWGHRRHFT